MKVTVLTDFRDKNNYSIVYKAGEVYDFDDARANALIIRGLAQKVEKERNKKPIKDDD